MEGIVIGLVLFVLGFVCRKRDKNFFANAIKVWGEVTAYRSALVRNHQRGGPYYKKEYYPIVRYYFNDQFHEVTGTYGSDTPPIIGHRKQVGINPENIEDVRVYSGDSELVDWISMLIGGLLILAGGGIFLVGLAALIL